MKPIALIGPAGTGKSTVGEILAGLLDRDFVDIDAIGHRYYDTVGQPVSDLIERIDVNTFQRAHRWWQPARLAALAALVDFPTAVIALGAGHSHFEDEERFEEAALGVSEDDPHAGQLPPRNLGMRSLELIGNVRGGFAEHLDPALSGRLHHGIVFQGVRVGRVGQQQPAHLAHVEQTVAIAPHRSTASARTR